MAARHKMTAMLEARLALVIFAVQDLPRAADFYIDAFGWPKYVDTPGYVELALPGAMRLGLYDRLGFAKNVGQTPPPVTSTISASELYLHVSDPDAAVENVTRAGGRVLDPLRKRDWGDEVAYVADPDGNVVALARALS